LGDFGSPKYEMPRLDLVVSTRKVVSIDGRDRLASAANLVISPPVIEEPIPAYTRDAVDNVRSRPGDALCCSTSSGD
jgi:hypothetical protein